MKSDASSVHESGSQGNLIAPLTDEDYANLAQRWIDKQLADAAGIVFVLWIVKPLFRRQAGKGRTGLILLAQRVGHFREGDVTTARKVFEYKFF